MRNSKWVTLILVTVLAVAFSGLIPASAASTTKKLSSNFTLVNLAPGTNGGTIQYVKPEGGDWKTADPFSFTTLGEQLIKRQYDDPNLPSGRGSVVVTSDGPLGAVVQVQARDGQVPTYGAYSGVSDGAASVGVPLVLRGIIGASGLANSQIVIQNASNSAITVAVDLIGAPGNANFTKTGINLAAGAAFEYDLADETTANLPSPWFGSAVVRSTTSGGEVAVVSNLFTGNDAMQTFNGFPQTTSAASTDAAQKWFVPLFTSRLGNGLSTPIAVQNVSGGELAIGSITLSCKKGEGSPDPATINKSNTAAVTNNASYFFNPVTDTSFDPQWYGSCIINTTGATNVFVQMRFVNPANANDPAYQNAAAYEGIATGNDVAVIPLYAKRLANGFATAITIQNLDETNAATVDLAYKAGAGTAGQNCTATIPNVNIPAGGSLIQNMRIESGANSVPQVGDDCFGTLTVTSKNGQDIAGFVQLTFVPSINPDFTVGDSFMAHNAFTISQ